MVTPYPPTPIQHILPTPILDIRAAISAVATVARATAATAGIAATVTRAIAATAGIAVSVIPVIAAMGTADMAVTAIPGTGALAVMDSMGIGASTVTVAFMVTAGAMVLLGAGRQVSTRLVVLADRSLLAVMPVLLLLAQSPSAATLADLEAA